MDDIIKLIDLSMEDGMLDKTDYEIIRKKAEQAGISEEELNLIISKRAKAPDKPLLEFNPSQKRTSVLPYILASLAIGFSFMNWFKAYSNTSVMGAKSDWEMYFSGWWGGYGATIILLYAIGCFLYFRSFRFYWIFGILAILDALYIYSALVNTDVSISYNYGGYGGSSKTGYDFAWGFWAYIVATGLFTFNGIVSEHILKGKKNVSLFGHFKENLKNGWKPMVLSSLISSIVILSDFLIDFDGDLIESLVIGLMLFVAISLYMVLVYVISPNARAAGYIVGAIHLALFIIDIFLLPDGANKPQLLLVLMVFPLSYILVERILNSKKNTSAIKGGVSVILISIAFSSCFNSTSNNSPQYQSISGTYSNIEGGVESSLTILGDIWFGTHTETSFGNVISTGSGTVMDNRIYDEYGIELGYISNGKAYVTIGGFDMTLYRE